MKGWLKLPAAIAGAIAGALLVALGVDLLAQNIVINGRTYVGAVLFDTSGNAVSVGGGTQYDRSTVAGADDKVNMLGVLQVAACGTGGDANGDRTVLQVNSDGYLCTNATGGGGMTLQEDDDDSIAAAQNMDAAIQLLYTYGGSTWARQAPIATQTTLAEVATNTDTTADRLQLLIDQQVDAAIHGDPKQPAGDQSMCYASTAVPTAVDADDAVRQWCDLVGRLHAVTEVVEDDAAANGAFLNAIGAVRRNAAASSAGADGDNATVNVDALGLLWTRALDPCSGVAKVYVPVDISSATTTELIDGSGASNYAYICSIHLVVGGANNVALVEDDTDTCGSPTAGMAGGVTAAEGWNFAANGGMVAVGGNASVARTSAVNRYVCLITSGTAQTSGTVVYALAP